jgi:transposase
MRTAPTINLARKDRTLLEAITENTNEPSKFVQRARIVLMAAEGLANQEIGERLGISRQKVGRWRERFAEMGIEGIQNDAPRSGRPPAISKCKMTRTANRTQNEVPPDSKRWTRRKMAEVSGLSPSTVGRIWQERGLKPHVRFKKPTIEEQEETALRLYNFRMSLADILDQAEAGEFR